MKKSEPKIVFNVSLTDEEFEEKIKIAMDEYAEKVIYKNLDETIQKIVEKRIERLLTQRCWCNDNMLQGKSFDRFVNEKTENTIAEIIDKNIKDILGKRLVAILTGEKESEE